MVDVTRTFTVERTREDVVAYLRDFANAADWDPGTQQCEQIGTDPIGLGTQWLNTSKLYGVTTSLTYELMRDEPDRLVFTGRNKTATSTEDLMFGTAGDAATIITYHAHVQFNGLARLGDPLAQLAFTRLADSVEQQMRRALTRV